MAALVESLKVIALISGGKDSLYSILHCVENGHEVVALANLFPAGSNSVPDNNKSGAKDEVQRTRSESEDLDSYMYQTVGHNVIPLYSEALGLPLYRQEINGTAVDTAANYSSATKMSSNTSLPPNFTVPSIDIDETESLIPLLERVKAAHPEANALSTGAILSTYQRTRVESVALRLGLVPLSFLWQYPSLPPYRQSSLLQDMAAVGVDARIIKVASGGLDERILWSNVADPQNITRLERDMGRFGGDVSGLDTGSVLGEGGEFETLALDGPRPVWKKKIEVDSSGRDIVMGEGGSALIRIKKARTVDKTGALDNARPRVPDLFDVEFSELLLKFETTSSEPNTRMTRTLYHHEQPSTPFTLQRHIITMPNAIHIANLTSRSSTNAVNEIQDIMCDLKSILKSHNRTFSNIAFVTILLRDMNDFITVNKIYGEYFTAPLPPSRATIACGESLPPGINVALSTIVHICDAAATRAGLHVQSRSYWAPANIGPYSQAISATMPWPSKSPALTRRTESEDDPQSVKMCYTHIAGQIPLLPTSNTLLGPSASFSHHAALALQHVWRIGRAMRVQYLAGCVAFIASSSAAFTAGSKASNDEAAGKAAVVTKIWQEAQRFVAVPSADEDAHSEDEDDIDIDIAELALRGRSWQAHAGQSGDAAARQRRLLPDRNIMPEDAVQIAVVEVAALPRGAGVEWLCGGVAVGSNAPHRAVERKDAGELGILRAVTEVGSIERLVADFRGEGRGLLGVCEIYVTDRIPAQEVDGLGVMVVPCRSAWVDGHEVLGVVRIL